MAKTLSFIDETGNENLIKFESSFPLFGLGALLISSSEYKKINNEIEKLKAKYFSNPKTFTLHSAELTRPAYKKTDPRNYVMTNKITRNNFYRDLNQILLVSEFKIIIFFARKDRLQNPKSYSKNLYLIAFENLLNRILKYGGKENLLTIEKRGLDLDEQLKLEYNKFCKLGLHRYSAKQLRKSSKLELRDKKENVNGLQIIDLILATLGRKYLGKEEKEAGNGLSLNLLTEKITEVTFIPQSIS